MVLPIVQYNDPVLRAKGAVVTVFDAELAQLVDDMVQTMHAAAGIGLAAQQIGRILQLCVIDLAPVSREFAWKLDGGSPPLDLIMPLTLVNPQIEFLPGEATVYEEGCLSFPGINGDVVRPHEIKVSFRDVAGGTHTLICNGLLGRCIQHEVDHLHGVLFIDRMTRKIRKSINAEIKELALRHREPRP